MYMYNNRMAKLPPMADAIETRTAIHMGAYVAGGLLDGSAVIDKLIFDDSFLEVTPKFIFGTLLIAGAEIYRRRSKASNNELTS